MSYQPSLNEGKGLFFQSWIEFKLDGEVDPQLLIDIFLIRLVEKEGMWQIFVNALVETDLVKEFKIRLFRPVLFR